MEDETDEGRIIPTERNVVVKAVIFDLDGTLLDTEGELYPKIELLRILTCSLEFHTKYIHATPPALKPSAAVR